MAELVIDTLVKSAIMMSIEMARIALLFLYIARECIYKVSFPLKTKQEKKQKKKNKDAG